MQAVLFDMDGTLLDSEKVWDVALDETAQWLGGQLSVQARHQIVGSSVGRSIGIIHGDLGIHGDPKATEAFLLDRTAQLFVTDLIFKPGAEQLLKAISSAGIPAALVTSTNRRLTEIALNVIGRQHFRATVCGDEVAHPKPDPEPYLTAARMLNAAPGQCVAIEDSPIGIASAEAAGCAVLAVPSEVPIAPAATRTVRSSLVDLSMADLQQLLTDRNS